MKEKLLKYKLFVGSILATLLLFIMIIFICIAMIKKGSWTFTLVMFFIFTFLPIHSITFGITASISKVKFIFVPIIEYLLVAKMILIYFFIDPFESISIAFIYATFFALISSISYLASLFIHKFFINKSK